MKQALVLIGLLISVLAPQARADDAADATKVAHDFVADLCQMDFDKLIKLGRPGDSANFTKPPDDLLDQFRELQNLPQLQDIRRQLADESAKAISLGPPALTPDNTCAIIDATPVAAEARKFAELMTLLTTYVDAARQAKAQGQPMPKVEDIRAQILAPGSPKLAEIASQADSFPSQKIRLQLEKTPDGWRVNLHAFQASMSDMQ